MTKSEELIAMWKAAVKAERGPYIAEQDQKGAPLLFSDSIRESADTWHQHRSYFAMRKEHQAKFHLNLIPEPYAGDIRRAPVVILMKNPGFDDHVYWEHEQEDYRKAMFANIRQDFSDGRPPFFSLRPEFSHMGNFRYFGRRLADLIEQFAEENHVSTQVALDVVARTICVVQMTGYTSKAPPSCDLLHSATVVRRWVHEEVLPAVKNHDRSLLVMRAVGEWMKAYDWQDLRAHCGPDLYLEEKNTRNPWFAPNSLQGQIILRRAKEVLAARRGMASEPTRTEESSEGVEG